MSNYISINPYNNQVLMDFPIDDGHLHESQRAFYEWRELSVQQRGRYLRKVADLLKNTIDKHAALITLEMGKPLKEAEYEITKTLSAFDYYIENAPRFLQDEVVETKASQSFIRYEPMGIIFSIMPWNFPYWQVFRFAIPTLMAGNVTVLKHAPNVPQCAGAIEDLFEEAGVPPGVFRNFYLTNPEAAKIIADPLVRGISFTGSDATGSLLAEQAGRHIKKCVLELGGNDPFIVLHDADLDFTVAGAIKSRSINSGQSCNAAKRFIVVEAIADAFTDKLVAAVKELKVGDPLEPGTQIGPLARVDLAEKVKKQIQDSIAEGAMPQYGMHGPETGGNFVTPVVLTHVKDGMPAFNEEIFGPVWSVVKVKDAEEAIAVANNSVYGLGASIWTADKQGAAKYISELQAGNVFINDIVKSDPRLPFGGVKRSGFGRELSEHGLREFVNIKTVYIN